MDLYEIFPKKSAAKTNAERA